MPDYLTTYAVYDRGNFKQREITEVEAEAVAIDLLKRIGNPANHLGFQVEIIRETLVVRYTIDEEGLTILRTNVTDNPKRKPT